MIPFQKTAAPTRFVSSVMTCLALSILLYTFDASCSTDQRNKVIIAIALDCRSAKSCCELNNNPRVKAAVEKLCKRDEPKPIIHCPNEHEVMPDGSKCTTCGKGFSDGEKIFLCPNSFDPQQQDNFSCPLRCVIFHEALHTQGLMHGNDMTAFDKCQGCTPQPSRN